MEAVKRAAATLIVLAYGFVYCIYRQSADTANVLKPVIKTFAIGLCSSLIDWWYWAKAQLRVLLQQSLIKYAPTYNYAAFIGRRNVTICLDTISLTTPLTCSYVKQNFDASILRLVNEDINVTVDLDNKNATRHNLITGKTSTMRLKYGGIKIDELMSDDNTSLAPPYLFSGRIDD